MNLNLNLYLNCECQKKAWKTHKKTCRIARATIALWDKDAGRQFTVADHDEREKRDILLAGLGSPTAQFNRGVAFEKGIGGPVDNVKAFLSYKTSAERGSAEAQYNVGLAYKLGNGVSADPRASFYWFKKSADQGFSLAQFNVGCFFAEGILGSVAMVSAVSWWEKSAEAGLAQGQHNLAKAYAHGTGGVRVDRAKSIYWYRKASLKGFVDSQFMLGLTLVFGGNQIEKIEAVRWIDLAADAGHEDAKKLKSDLEGVLSCLLL